MSSRFNQLLISCLTYSCETSNNYRYRYEFHAVGEPLFQFFLTSASHCLLLLLQLSFLPFVLQKKLNIHRHVLFPVFLLLVLAV